MVFDNSVEVPVEDGVRAMVEATLYGQTPYTVRALANQDTRAVAVGATRDVVAHVHGAIRKAAEGT